MSDQDLLENKTGVRLWIKGLLAAFPIVLGYIPVGFAYGVLAHKAGLSTFNILLMSTIVFAGSAQFIAVGLISAGVTPISIILTRFIVNLRHLLFSAALSPYVAQWRKIELSGFAFELTDETFAIHSTRFDVGLVSKAEAFAINFTAHVAWIIGSWLGVVFGNLVADITPLALDYVLPAMFIALLVMQIHQQTQLWAAIIAGTISVVLILMGFSQSHVIIGTIIGATFGAWVEGWKKT